ncbi:MAG TPA: hypothetical protein VFJ58_26500 [Armatimonadota bacterium]|nr:hypothetical protein [Armatimonadota bacterium]
MNLLLIIFDASLEERVLDSLRRIGVPGYSLVRDLTGFGRTGRREGDPIWPGTNSMLMVVVPEGVMDSVREMLSRLKQEYTRPPALHVFSLDATEIL